MNNPGKIWCLYFKILTNALQRHGIESLKYLLKDIVEVIELSPYFDPSAWDWSTTQKMVAEEISRLNDDVQRMINGLDNLLLNPREVEAFRGRWLEP